MNYFKLVCYQLIISLLVVLGFSCKPAEEPKPNILWIVSEDNSPFLGAYGDNFATTPNLDRLATNGILYENAFSPAPVCAPTKSSIITGVFANSLGTQHMRSKYPIPNNFIFYPSLIQEAGYYCTNRSGKDYNTIDQVAAWNESGQDASYKNRKEGQPFFQIYSVPVSHESSIHKYTPLEELRHDPEKVPIPPYHPRTEEMKHDWAQYYDKVEDMDTKVGEILEELEKEGLRESTIVFYSSDHGGVLGRSKRFMYESGLKVPLIVSVPKKFQHMVKEMPGTSTSRAVNLMDLGPTFLNLIGVDIPAHMQGKPFLRKNTKEMDKTYGFRGRMDERYDMVRTVRNKEFRYVKNYMPHRIYGQYVGYLWRAPSMKSWEQAHLNGELNEVQSAFWNRKPAEELYKISSDPHNINNLADNPEYTETLMQMRGECQAWQKEIVDVGFIPEPMIERISVEIPMYEYVRQSGFQFDHIMETAEMASSLNPDYNLELTNRLGDENPIVRYWSLVGCAIFSEQATAAKEKIKTMTTDKEVSIRVAAAEVLYNMGEKETATKVLIKCLDSPYLMGRTMALNVIDQMGEDAIEALPIIQEFVARSPKSKNYDVRAAKRAIEKLTEI